MLRFKEGVRARSVSCTRPAPWRRVVEQEDFYEDTERIARMESSLRELGIEPVP